MMVDCFTDASYSKSANGSVIGYKIGHGNIVLDFLPEIKNTQAEVLAVKFCVDEIEKMYPNNKVLLVVHTDCQKVMTLDMCTQNISVVYVKMIGHMKKSLMNDKQKIFSAVDKAVRKELRLRNSIKNVCKSN
jgi:hypothetical protein